jgi:hypothetical protein
VNEPIDITPGGPIPPADPVAARRRMWIGLLAAGAVASVVAGGVGYAALNQPEQRRTTVLPVVSPPVLPFGGDLLPTVGAVPSAGPVVESAADPAATGPVASPASARPTRKRPAQPVMVVPTAITAPPAQPSPQATFWPLTAVYSGGGEPGWDGITGYGGSVRLTNSGERGPAGNWRVRLTVPGGNPVHAGGNATVSQSGERVVFAPGPGGVVHRGGSVTVDFWIDGVLPAAPYGCLVNGRACG